MNNNRKNEVLNELESSVMNNLPCDHSIVLMSNLLDWSIEPELSSRLFKILQVSYIRDNLLELLEKLDQLGIFKMYSYFHLVQQNLEYHPEGNLENHMRLVMQSAKKHNFNVALGALVHDFGKPISYLAHGNTYDHAHTGKPYIERFCKLMGLDKQLTDLLVISSEEHIRAHSSCGKNALKPKKLLALLDKLRYKESNEFFTDCLNIFEVDLLGRGGTPDVESVNYLRKASEVASATDDPLLALNNFVRKRKEKKSEVYRLTKGNILNLSQKAWLEDIIHDLKLEPVAVIVTGSLAQGLETEDSDIDVVCVYLDNVFGALCNKRYKYRDGEVELAFKSVVELVKNLERSDTNAINLLFAKEEHLLLSSKLWDKLQGQRHTAIAKNMQGLTNYAVKTMESREMRSRDIKALEYIIPKLEQFTHTPSVEEWGDMVSDVPDYCYLTHEVNNPTRKLLVVGNRKYNLNVDISKLLSELNKRLNQLRKSDNAIDDVKAVLHGTRSAMLYSHLIKSRTRPDMQGALGANIQLPKSDMDLLKSIKAGKGPDHNQCLDIANAYYLAALELANKLDLPQDPQVDTIKDMVMNGIAYK